MLRPHQLLDEAQAEPPQNRGRIGIVRLEPEQHLGQAAPLFQDQRLEECLLAVEIDIQGALGDARSLRDLAHAGAIEALRQEDPPRPVEDLPPLGAVAIHLGGRLRSRTGISIVLATIAVTCFD